MSKAQHAKEKRKHPCPNCTCNGLRRWKYTPLTSTLIYWSCRYCAFGGWYSARKHEELVECLRQVKEKECSKR